MASYLIRHATAGVRGRWNGDDTERPLDDGGRRQAELIADRFGGCAIKRVVSSPARRCVETVAPLAERLGLDVEMTHELAEGAPPHVAFGLIEDGTALCAHGDLIPALLDRLVEGGMVTEGKRRSAKGSVWELEPDGDGFSHGRYLPSKP